MTAIERAWSVLKEWSQNRGRPVSVSAQPAQKPNSGKFQLQQAIRDARPVRHKPESWGAYRQTEEYNEEEMQRQFEALRALVEQQGGARNE